VSVGECEYIGLIIVIITRRPCCRREPPRDAKHLHRELAPPRATQWIERTLKLSANMGKVPKNHFKSVSVKD